MSDSESSTADAAKESRLAMISAAGVFLAALIVRILYLAQSSDNPTFFEPILDSYVYHEAAVAMASGHLPATNLFWQPIFYPCFLAGFYSIFGEQLWLARLFQAALGAVTCVLLFWAGRLALSRREGFVAGLMLAFYGPVVFYEAEPLAEGWALFWIAALFVIFILLRQHDSPGLWFAAGLCGSLAMLTRPPLLPFFALAAAIQLFRCFRRSGAREMLIRICFLAFSFGIPAYAAGYANYQLTGYFGVMPYSSGINLYIGNNPDWERTVIARPGVEWDSILQLAEASGPRHPHERSAFFHDEVRRYIREQPRAFIRGLALKTLRFLNSRELPRNEDIYLFRQWSPLLAALVWKAGPFGFPFGLIAPLALLGLIRGARRLPAPAWALLLTYPPVIILHFISARYRILVLPALLLPAAVALCRGVELVRTRKWRIILPALPILAGLALLSAFPLHFSEEPPGVNYEAELYRCLGRQAFADNRLGSAGRHLRHALSLRPDYADAMNELGCVQLRDKQFDPAFDSITRALSFDRDNVVYNYNLGLVHLGNRDFPRAEAAFRHTLELNPRYVPARGNLGILLYELGRHAESIRELKQVLSESPENPRATDYLRMNIEAQRQALRAPQSDHPKEGTQP